ncbi:MAG: O-acetyl-ADP-ribose deacetylase [Candidatus Omnitrophota bacterium]
MTKIEIVLGDITRIEVDAIVNAANRTLLGGGGVDGAIHRAAGPQLLAECLTLGGCETGRAKITKGYNLPARFVIHTVGPVWYGGKHNEEADLCDCYYNSLQLAKAHGIRSIAFPAISTGAYRFPLESAMPIAFKTAQRFIEKNPDALDRLIFVLFSAHDHGIYRSSYAQYFHG